MTSPQRATNAPESITVGTTVVPCADVQLVVAEGNFLNPWKRTVVVTAADRYVIAGAPHIIEAYYTAFVQNCPYSVGIPYKGDAHPPQLEGEEAGGVKTGALANVKREMRRRGRLAWLGVLVAIIIAAPPVIAVIWAVQYDLNEPVILWIMWIMAILGIVFALLMITARLKHGARGRHVIAAIQSANI